MPSRTPFERLDEVDLIRLAYASSYDVLVAELAPREARARDPRRTEAELSVQAAFLEALHNPRAFALREDRIGWLRAVAARSARTRRWAPASLDLQGLVTVAQRRRRRVTTTKVAVAVAVFALVLVVSAGYLGLSLFSGGLVSP